MANWAAYKEKEIGLPVFKRAKHGIHFDKGKGEILAEFVGKPCHYFDGKLWQAIDTRPLLRKDGSYGCPHSDVIIKPDGTVQVGEYAQKAALILPGKISVDGDRIARPFSGGVQYLYITENGFRQEIVLEKMPDLKKVASLVDTVSGVLPSKCTASALSLKDSSTAELSDSVQVDKTSLASVLEAAKYPVVIDPDFSVGNTNYGDFTMYSGGSPYYNSLRNYGANDTFRISTNINAIFRFDLSTIAAESTCNSVTFKPTKVEGTSANSRTYYIYSLAAANTDWIEGTKAGTAADSGEPCYSGIKADGAGGITTAWAGSEGCNTSGTDYEATALMSIAQKSDADNPTQYSWDFNAAGIARVEDWFGGITNNYGMMIKGNCYNESTFAFSEHATAGYRPVLTVTYTAATSGNPFYYFRQQQ